VPGFEVASIAIGKDDASGLAITTVYAKNAPFYAVYGAANRVNIQYADDPTMAQAQRAALVRLNPNRGQINGLIEDRRTDDVDDEAYVSSIDRRVADALIVGCEGDVDSADQLLSDLKAEIIGQRTARARFLYLMYAAACTATVVVVSIVLCVVIYVLIGSEFDLIYPIGAQLVLYAIAAGALGTLFSISTGLRARTILTDLHMDANRGDALLRMVIGITAAPVLVCILCAGFTSFSLGGQSFGLAINECAAKREGWGLTLAQVSLCSDVHEPLAWWIRLLVIGFVAGFSERFVPDLLARATAGAAPSTPPAPSGGQASIAPVVAAGATAQPVTKAANEPDNCLSEAPVAETEATDDADLPAASGG